MAKRSLEFNINLKTSDPSVLVNLFGVELPTEGTENSLAHGVTIKAQHVEVQHGLVETSVIVSCVVQVIAGIATKVIGDLLVDLLKDRKAKLAINDRHIDNLTTPLVVSAMEGGADAK